MNPDTLIFDLMRLVIFVLYGATLGQVLWIVRTYGTLTGRLLPRHILTVGIAMVLALTEVAYENASRVGDGFTWYIPVNTVIIGLSFYALNDMVKHLRRRRHGGTKPVTYHE